MKKMKIWVKILLITTAIPLTTIISCSPTNAKNVIDNGEDGDSDNNDKEENDVEYLEYEDIGNLRADDKWWTLKGNEYTNEVKRGVGKLFYSNIDKRNNKWSQLTLDDWYDAYDTKFDDMLEDPNHIYKDTANHKYESGTKGYKNIYLIDPNNNLSVTRSGNNNNPFNAFYTGSKFRILDGSSKHHYIETSEHITGHPLDWTTGKKSDYVNNWEHVSPASKEGIVFEGHRSKVNDAKYPIKFGYSIGDLHNLRPSWARTNQPRSNYPYGIVPGNDYKYGGIDFEIGDTWFGLKVTEPRVNVRGDIARILFYMHDRYHVKYDLGYYKQLLLWSLMDPVTPQEKLLDKRISGVMGFSNDYVSGVKLPPYDKEIYDMVKKANEDKTENAFTWTRD